MSKNLKEKLSVWGKDKIVRKDGEINVSDYYCVKCLGKNKKVPATQFWPCIDPDIKNYPYCAKCVQELEMEIFLEMEKNKNFYKE
jgi:hypothetical protein